MKERQEQVKNDEEFAKKLFLEQELEKGEEKDEFRPSTKDFTLFPLKEEDLQTASTLDKLVVGASNQPNLIDNEETKFEGAKLTSDMQMTTNLITIDSKQVKLGKNHSNTVLPIFSNPSFSDDSSVQSHQTQH